MVKFSKYWDLVPEPLFEISFDDRNKLLEAIVFEVIADLAESIRI